MKIQGKSERFSLEKFWKGECKEFTFRGFSNWGDGGNFGDKSLSVGSRTKFKGEGNVGGQLGFPDVISSDQNVESIGISVQDWLSLLGIILAFNSQVREHLLLCTRVPLVEVVLQIGFEWRILEGNLWFSDGVLALSQSVGDKNDLSSFDRSVKSSIWINRYDIKDKVSRSEKWRKLTKWIT